jgi:hypothetical protein
LAKPKVAKNWQLFESGQGPIGSQPIKSQILDLPTIGMPIIGTKPIRLQNLQEQITWRKLIFCDPLRSTATSSVGGRKISMIVVSHLYS